ncbi:MAG TPA: PhzF family phenazine biosynthesis protein [Gemmatimonadales bacterium]|nr:PhzF family phenazine biosynthesis protein [Gemmatimonadales bacterium]
MRYRYFMCDVFTGSRFGGNQLAVLPEAKGLSDRQMQQIAREFNFSESTFVLPAEQGKDRRVRIFTPTREIPFAGHPNVGTAFVLATIGAFGKVDAPITVTFEEKAGPVPVSIRRLGGTFSCELSAPERLSLGKRIPAEMVATALSVTPADIVTTTHPPQTASVGLPFLMVELKDRSALAKARVNAAGFDAIQAQGVLPDIHMYTKSGDEFDIRARMFAPVDGVPEDPATGSANCALAGLLRYYGPATDGIASWRIAQGVEMGRPSVLEARAEKRGGAVVAAWVGGTSVMVSEGTIEVE